MAGLKDDLMAAGRWSHIYNLTIGTTGTYQYPLLQWADNAGYMFRLQPRAANGGVIFVGDAGKTGEGWSVGGDTGWIDGQFVSGTYVLWGDTAGDILEVFSRK